MPGFNSRRRDRDVLVAWWRLTAVFVVVLGALAGPATALADIGGVVSTATSAVQQTKPASTAATQ
jgi:hypothetical protein